MSVPDILPIPGVPEELLWALNDRFRRLLGPEVQTSIAALAAKLKGQGSIPMVSDPGALHESAITDNGVTVELREPLNVHGAIQAEGQVHIQGGNLRLSSADLPSTMQGIVEFSAPSYPTAYSGIAGETGVADDQVDLVFYVGYGTAHETMRILAASQHVGFGLSAPGYRVDINGDANVSGVYRVGGVAGISVTIALAKLTSGGANGSATYTGGILTAYSAPT